MLHPSLLMIALAAAPLLSAPPALRAQSAPVAPAYADRFAEVMALSPAPDGVADVSNLVLQRDLARFTLKSGKLYLLTPIGGRTVAALFRGTGTFSFAPASPVEQHRLARYENKTALEAPFTDLLLMFADTTMAELRTLTFRAEPAPGEVRERVRDGLKYLSDEDSKTFDPDLMGALLNGDTTDLFYAHIRRQGAEPLMFTLNPHEVEAREPQRQGHALVGGGSGSSLPVPAARAVRADAQRHRRAHRPGGDPPVRHERRPAAERHRRDRASPPPPSSRSPPTARSAHGWRSSCSTS